MAYVAYDATAYQGQYHVVTAIFPATTAGATALANWVNANEGNTALEVSKDVYRDVLGAHVGWFVELSSNTLHQFPPPPAATPASQRQEIYRLLLDNLRSVDVARLSAKQGAVEAAGLRARSLGCYASVQNDNSVFDTLKTEARIDLNEWALYANTTDTAAVSWLTALRQVGLFLYVAPDSPTVGGLNRPNASAPTGLVAPTLAQLQAFDVRESIA